MPPFRTLQAARTPFPAWIRPCDGRTAAPVRFMPNRLVVALLVATAMALGPAGCVRQRTTVTQIGAMRAVMREGQSEPRANLRAMTATPAMYGVGAMAGLDGEVTIHEGEVWITRVKDGTPVTTGPVPAASEQATLLTFGPVARFQNHVLISSLSGEALEQAIREAAARDGIDARRPFLFTLHGQATSMRMHVVDGTCLHADPTAPGLRLEIAEPTAVEIVGVHAEGQAGVMTHHGTSVHMHALLEWHGQPLTAHVDSAAMAPGATLSIPADMESASP